MDTMNGGGKLVATEAAYRPADTLYCSVEDESVIHIKAFGPVNEGIVSAFVPSIVTNGCPPSSSTRWAG
jgi:hypothetical protein